MKKYIFLSLFGLVGSVYAVKEQHYICTGDFKLSQSLGAQSRSSKQLIIGTISLPRLRSKFNFCSPAEAQQARSAAAQSGSNIFLKLTVKNANKSSDRQAPKNDKQVPKIASQTALNAHARALLSENMRVYVAALQKIKRRKAKRAQSNNKITSDHIFTTHAKQRMSERKISAQEVASVLKSGIAKRDTLQKKGTSIRVGTSKNNRGITVVVDKQSNAVITTYKDKTIGSSKKASSKKLSTRREGNKPEKSRNQKQASRFTKTHPKFYLDQE